MDSALKFKPTEDQRVQQNENYLVFQWNDGDILFSVTQKGQAAYVHLFCDNKHLRNLKRACSEFVDFTFYLFDWCEMIIVTTDTPSIGRLVSKIGFTLVATSPECDLYTRCR